MATATLNQNRKYLLNGLDCANCALKIETQIKKLPYVKNASVNFSTATMKVQLSPEATEIESVDSEFTKLITRMEPEVEVIDITDGMPKSARKPVQVHEHDHCSCEGHDHEHDHTHEHEHSHEETPVTSSAVEKLAEKSSPFRTPEFYKIVASGVLLLAGIFLPGPDWFQMLLLAASVLICGFDVLKTGFKNLFHLQFEEDLLMTIAVIAAFIINQAPEGAMVMFLFCLGEFIEDLAVDKSRQDIAALSDIRPDSANLLQPDGSTKAVDAMDVQIGDVIVLRAGDRVPLDCIVTEGTSQIDTSALTGESLPQSVEVGTTLLSGSVNISRLLTCEVTTSYQNSAASRIVSLVEDSVEKKGETEKFITKFARIYTPIVIVCAVILAVIPPLFNLGTFEYWIYNALVFLVASCPCAFVIAVPLGFYSAIGSASKAGLLVKGGKYIETLAATKVVCLDKTGTITTGKLAVDEVVSFIDTVPESEVLHLAALLESLSSHPMAQAVVNAYGETLDTSSIKNTEEIAGQGIVGIVDGKKVLCGSARLLEENGIQTDAWPKANIYLAIEDQAVGQIFISDQVKESSVNIAETFKNVGVERVIMLTGDNAETAEKVAKVAGITEYRANLLPGDKVVAFEEIKATSGNTLFVGDGINDAPVLAMADTGVAMGMGSDLAIESADVVLMSGSLQDLARGIRLSQKSLRMIHVIIAFALIVKLTVLSLAIFGLAPIWLAVIADVGVSIVAVILSTRIMQYYKKV